MRIKCDKCNSEFSEEPNDYPGKVYVHHGEIICEDCLVDMGVMPDSEDPEETYLYTRADIYRTTG